MNKWVRNKIGAIETFQKENMNTEEMLRKNNVWNQGKRFAVEKSMKLINQSQSSDPNSIFNRGSNKGFQQLKSQEDEQTGYAKRAYLCYRKSYGQECIQTVRRSISSLRTSIDDKTQSAQVTNKKKEAYINLQSSTKYRAPMAVQLANKLRSNTTLEMQGSRHSLPVNSGMYNALPVNRRPPTLQPIAQVVDIRTSARTGNDPSSTKAVANDVVASSIDVFAANDYNNSILHHVSPTRNPKKSFD